jgi:hypothetical protein
VPRRYVPLDEFVRLGITVTVTATAVSPLPGFYDALLIAHDSDDRTGAHLQLGEEWKHVDDGGAAGNVRLTTTKPP